MIYVPRRGRLTPDLQPAKWRLRLLIFLYRLLVQQAQVDPFSCGFFLVAISHPFDRFIPGLPALHRKALHHRSPQGRRIKLAQDENWDFGPTFGRKNIHINLIFELPNAVGSLMPIANLILPHARRFFQQPDRETRFSNPVIPRKKPCVTRSFEPWNWS